MAPDPAAAQFFFGAMSPYSWFAAERIQRLLPEATWRPLFAGGLFVSAGRGSWGLDDRRVAGLADCEERARTHGLAITWPDPWPTLDLLVARAMVVAERDGALREFALAAMRLAFVEGGDLDRPEVVARAAELAGLDPEHTLRLTATPSCKAEVRARVEGARELGVLGVPTVVVGGELFWGDDRLEQAAHVAYEPST